MRKAIAKAWAISDLNLRRGLLRVWVLGSVCWAVGAGFVLYDAEQQLVLRCSQNTDGVFSDLPCREINYTEIIVVSLVPPVLVLVASILAFFAFRWVKNGFKKEPKR